MPAQLAEGVGVSSLWRTQLQVVGAIARGHPIAWQWEAEWPRVVASELYNVSDAEAHNLVGRAACAGIEQTLRARLRRHVDEQHRGA